MVSSESKCFADVFIVGSIWILRRSILWLDLDRHIQVTNGGYVYPPRAAPRNPSRALLLIA
jgi:hypothetical protein